MFKKHHSVSGKSVTAAGIATAGALLVLVSGSGYEIRRTSGLAQASAPTSSASATTSGSVQNLFVNISDRLMPSVVNIFTTKNFRARSPRSPGFPNDPWGGLFGDLPGGSPFGNPYEDESAVPSPRGHSGGGAISARPMALGTGFVIEAENGKGLIMTNNHVIEGADDVQVKFTESDDEHEVTAQIVGRDPELDVALLRVQTDRKLTPVTLGDSDRLKVGEWIAAVGNPFGHGHSMSHGIVSAKERTLPGGFGKYLQTDAPINPGNSGGPLVNVNGEVVGINNAIDARGPGIGFAIPINAVKDLLPQLKSAGHVERGFIGVNIMPLQPELARALKADAPDGAPVVTQVMPGQPAALAGLMPYDVIAKVDGHPVKSTSELMTAILRVPVGKKIQAEVIRSGHILKVDVPVARRPEPQRS
jgi:serine protease Do